MAIVGVGKRTFIARVLAFDPIDLRRARAKAIQRRFRLEPGDTRTEVCTTS